ncbi:MAG: hypothetical protein J6A89_02070 [Clostridia bacterium]|nr:hypothetical protein [Clostridia bacterium]
MLAKIWKKLLLVVLIIACLVNVITKFVKKSSLKDEITASARYVRSLNNEK